MDRVSRSTGKLNVPEEEFIYKQVAVSIYDEKDQKTPFQTGELQLSSHRLFWADKNQILEINLFEILNAELKLANQIGSGLSKTKQVYSRIIINFDKPPKSVTFIQFEFEYGGHKEFYQQLDQQLIRKKWLYSNTGAGMHGQIGIVGIQRKMQDRLDKQDQQIQDSFKDLSVLMNQAKDMVNLSNALIAKITKNTASTATANENEDDEDLKKLKGYFVNMGIIDNPVTKELSGSKYYKDLAMEINNNLGKTINDCGGIMTLTDVYCRLNRARGMAGLISVDDLLNACKEINKQSFNLKYNVYKDLNLHVLEVETSNQSSKKLNEICSLVEKNQFLTAYSLSKLFSCNLIVAKKYLLDCEKLGLLCRDDTSHGLAFYNNLFLQK